MITAAGSYLGLSSKTGLEVLCTYSFSAQSKENSPPNTEPILSLLTIISLSNECLIAHSRMAY